MEFEKLWKEMKELASSVKEFKTIGGRTTFKTRLVGDTIEIDSYTAQDLQYITKDSTKENFDIYNKLPRHEKYNTSHYQATWNKAYVLSFFKEIL